jgi:hypothetical protein
LQKFSYYLADQAAVRPIAQASEQGSHDLAHVARGFGPHFSDNLASGSGDLLAG